MYTDIRYFIPGPAGAAGPSGPQGPQGDAGGGTATPVALIPENGHVLPLAAARAYYTKVLYSPTAIFHDGTSLRKYVAFYGKGTGTAVAYSDDGYTWTNEATLTGIVSTGYHCEPVLIGTTVYFYYWDGVTNYAPTAIRRAQIDITTNCSVAASDTPLAGDYIHGVTADLRRGTYGPAAIFYNATPTDDPSNPYSYAWCMIHDGTDGAFEAMFFAVSTDGLTFSAWNGLNEVIPRGTYPDWDAYTGTMVAWQAGGMWHAIYSGGIGTIHGSDGNYADGLGYATSSDGITWTKNTDNPIFTKAFAYKAAKRLYNPCLVKEDDGWRLYYSAKSQTGVYTTCKAIVNFLV